MTDRFALVALPLPLATPYTYRIPDTLGDRVVPGARVVVPVRRRELIGLVGEARGTLAKAFKELTLRWNEARAAWDDAQAERAADLDGA